MTFGIHYYDKNGCEITAASYWYNVVEERNLQIAALQEQVQKLAAENNRAVQDVIAERQRQQAVEGWTPEHDDEHQSNELVSAAVEYATHVVGRSWVFPSQPDKYTGEKCSNDWPWDESWWKPKSPRQDLVRAAALLIAEIERLDRAGEQP